MQINFHFEMKKFFLILLFFSSLTSKSQTVINDTIRLNHYKVLASHNSYKKNPNPKVIKFLSKFKKQLGPSNDPELMDYGHVPLPEQFDNYNIRGIEIDVNYDPKGGLYRKRKVNKFITGLRQKVKDPLMKQPGFKVLHIADVDYETNYLTFKQILNELKSWSDAHPKHTPIFINIESKGFNPGDESGILRFLGFKRALQFDTQSFQDLDKEILEILPADKIFKPTDLKGNYSSIKERLNTEGWPLLSTCLGKIIFILEGNNQDLYEKSGVNRPMFVYNPPNGDNTAFVVKNDPIGNEQEIELLTQKYIVRTRSDAGTLEARANDYKRFNAAIKSGAQIISTDYYKPDPRLGSFVIKLK
jgi:hypothetical protein